jgi:hypothetical protein
MVPASTSANRRSTLPGANQPPAALSGHLSLKGMNITWISISFDSIGPMREEGRGRFDLQCTCRMCSTPALQVLNIVHKIPKSRTSDILSLYDRIDLSSNRSLMAFEFQYWLCSAIGEIPAYLCFEYPPERLEIAHDLSSSPTDSESAVKLAPAKPTNTSPFASQTSTSK